MVQHTRKGAAVLAACILLVGALCAAFPIPAAYAGSTSWVKLYERSQDTMASDVLAADDGGYFIVGTTDVVWEPVRQGNVYLLRIDAAGALQWEQTYSADGYQGGQGIIQTSDGNLLIAGVSDSGGDSGLDAYLLTVDQDGNVLWSTTYSGPLDEMIGGIAPTPDGGYLLGGNVVDPDDFVSDPGAAGYGGFEGRSSLYVMKIDAAGSVLWTKTFDNGENMLGAAAALAPDGGMLILANIVYFPEPGDDLLLLKLDAEGNEEWTRTWMDGQIAGQSMITTSDGHILISAAYTPGDEDPRTAKADFLFIKLDQDGEQIWESVFGDPNMVDYGKVLVEAADGGFFVVSEQTPDHYTWEADLALVKIDADGQYVGETAMPGTHTMFSNIVPHTDGGYLVVGSTFNGSVFNILLIKSDADGAFPVE